MGMRKIELLLSSHTCNRIYVAKKITRLSLTVKLWVKEMATNDPLMIILFISLTIPENMNALGGTIKTQWAIVCFEKIC